jgi:hypothetical protein
MKNRSIILACAAVAVFATATLAAVNFDPGTGTGFVGKGDVQLVFGWNNKQLQDNASSVQFRSSSEVVTEVSWECTNTNNDNIQERARTSTTTVAGVLSAEGRDNKGKITGFILNGYDGDPTETSVTDGPELNTCPSGPWTLTTPAGDPEVIGVGASGLQVSIDGTAWADLD